MRLLDLCDVLVRDDDAGLLVGAGNPHLEPALPISGRAGVLQPKVARAPRDDFAQGRRSFAGLTRKMRARFTDRKVIQPTPIVVAYVARLLRKLPPGIVDGENGAP